MIASTFRRFLLAVVPLLSIARGSAIVAAAEVQYPVAIVATTDGTIFIADRQLPGIWKVTPQGPELYFEGSKKFGTPLNAVRCLAIDKDGRLLAGDSATREVYRFGDDGKPVPLTNGGIGIPMGIAVQSDGDLLVSDLELHRIWKVPAAGGTPTLHAEVPGPLGLGIDGSGQLFVVSRGKYPVRKVLADGKLEPVVSEQKFQFPHAIAFDEQQAIYVCDSYAKTIWKIVPGQEPVAWSIGEPLQNPVGVAWHAGGLIIVDPKAKAVFQADAEGKLTKLASW